MDATRLLKIGEDFSEEVVRTLTDSSFLKEMKCFTVTLILLAPASKTRE